MPRPTCQFAVLVVCAVLAGCTRSASRPAAGDPPEAYVGTPVVRTITDYEDFPGRTAAVAGVEVRARVTGYLEKVLFKEGTEVKQGERLFEIDARAYDAELKRAEAILQQGQSRLKRCQLDFNRAADLLPHKAISREEFDRYAGDRDEAAAAVRLAEAARDLAQLNVTFTKVTAPIGGRISRQLIDPGNLVKADDTLLTTIVAQDSIYAYFDVDERTMLRVRRMIRAGKMKSSREAAMPVFLGLVDEEGFPHEGVINFVDNQVDVMTGTLRLRGIFANPNRLLSPGLFVRIRLPIGKPRAAVLLSEQTLGTDQGQKFVYLVNEKDEVVYREVKVGPLHDGLRVIEEGVKEGDRVIVNGLQRVKAGIKIQARPAVMPIAGAPAGPPLVTKGP